MHYHTMNFERWNGVIPFVRRCFRCKKWMLVADHWRKVTNIFFHHYWHVECYSRAAVEGIMPSLDTIMRPDPDNLFDDDRFIDEDDDGDEICN